MPTPTLGFSTGSLNRTGLSLLERIDTIRNTGCNALELGFVKLLDFYNGEMEELTKKDLMPFDHVSLHAPIFPYDSRDESASESKEILRRIAALNRKRRLDLVVFHPDPIVNFGIFRKINFNLALENMDCRKHSCKTVEDMETVMNAAKTQNKNFRMVLDVNHAFSNDPMLKLTADLQRTFGADIAQIHLSGYTGSHEALYETGQAEIIHSIEDFSIPIIVESVLTPDTIAKEYAYILNIIASKEDQHEMQN